jgi:hypothetical protein
MKKITSIKIIKSTIEELQAIEADLVNRIEFRLSELKASGKTLKESPKEEAE